MVHLSISALILEPYSSYLFNVSVLKDVKKMLQLGFFPEGHLDAKETCLMLDHATYQEYQRIENERKALAIEEAQKKKKLENFL